jgi:two-component system alkaline phosphatase synthesis response regulator PhoP
VSALIYYVEDDQNIRDLACYALEQSGFETVGFPDATGFVAACEKRVPDLVLLDIMLPGTDGLTLLRDLRANARLRGQPIMMITARGTELDVVCGLEAGADDYLTKPFGMMELISRVNALLRMAARGSDGSGRNSLTAHTCGALTLEIERHRVMASDREIDLTAKEFALLQTLMEYPGRVFTRSQLLERVWGYGYGEGTRTVDVHVQTLRQKLGEAGAQVGTVRGVGYRLLERGGGGAVERDGDSDGGGAGGGGAHGGGERGAGGAYNGERDGGAHGGGAVERDGDSDGRGRDDTWAR